MAQKNVILEELEALNSLKDLAESYEEIAAIRMQKIKDSVLQTRNFLSDLSDVFVDLKSSYNRELKDLLSHLKKVKSLMVYLSSNGKLYGSVTQNTFNLFVRDLSRYAADTTDVLVIGQAGRELLQNSGIARKFDYFEIPDTNVDVSHIRELVSRFIKYEQVKVYYGKFDNVIRQNPIATSITGENIFEEEVQAPVSREDRFIFEPTLEKLFNFFQTQITANLFSQTLLENQLARHASRVNAMEKALVHIEEEGRRLGKERNRIRHQVQNLKQLETISGLVLWQS